MPPTNQYVTDVASLNEIVGNDHAVSELRKFASDIEAGAKRRPMLIYGPSGTGKTASAHALAAEFKWNIVELSASDYRDKETIEKVLVAPSNSRTLFGRRNVIILDEIDELAPRFDKGANAAITKLIHESKSPMLLIANDKWDRNISFLRGLVDDVRFAKVPDDVLRVSLSGLSDREKLGLTKNVIDAIVKRSSGDVRSAFIDAFALAGSNDEAADIIGLRDRDADIFSTLDKIFSTYTIYASQSARSALSDDVQPEMMVNWMEENIPKRYTYVKDNSSAFDALARSTIFLSRATRSQNYGYWRYANLLMSSGVALAKRNYPNTARKYAFPRIIKELSVSKERRGMDRQIAIKMQRGIHESVSVITKEHLPLFSAMVRAAEKNGEDAAVVNFFESRYNLSEKEIKWLEKPA
jgi:replication factor C large subunit